MAGAQITIIAECAGPALEEISAGVRRFPRVASGPLLDGVDCVSSRHPTDRVVGRWRAFLAAAKRTFEGRSLACARAP